MGRVRGIHIHEVETQKPRPVEAATIAPGGGIEGDSHSSARDSRRVLLVNGDVLSEHGLTPGDLREQLTVEGVDVDSLSTDTELAIGNAVARVIKPCAPCLTIGGYLGVEDAERFRVSLENKRGIFVVFRDEDAGVQIRLEDEVRIL
jgi:hypothetical protein